jgi:hypothetical protein
VLKEEWQWFGWCPERDELNKTVDLGLVSSKECSTDGELFDFVHEQRAVTRAWRNRTIILYARY